MRSKARDPEEPEHPAPVLTVVAGSGDHGGTTTAPDTNTRPATTAGDGVGWALTSGRTIVPSLVLRMHFYIGVLIAPFLIIAAASGLAFVFTPQLDRIVYADQLFVDRVGPAARPLAEQVAAARRAHPEGTVTSVIPPAAREDTTRVVVSLPGLGEKRHTVYVDPYTNEVRGTLTTWFGSTPLTTWIDDLHRNLHLGAVGRHYSELAASWLWVLVFSGLILWLNRQWKGRRRLRDTALPDLTAGRGVRRTRGWHATTGLWLAIGLLTMSATGLTWSRYAGANFDLMQNGLDAHRPTLDSTLPGAGTGGNPEGGHHEEAGGGSGDAADVDRVVITARRAGLTGPVEATLPDEEGTGWTVAQIDDRWPIGRDRVVVDPAARIVVARSDFADWPVLAQLASIGVVFHMGYLFGPVNQILLLALGIGLLCVVFWGYRMWWQRRPTRADRAALLGTPPARGALRRTHPAVLMIWVLGAATIGSAIPLLGVSLLGFLTVDVLLGQIYRRRATSAGRARGAA